jgi:DNA polymerase II small subunit/DNA polymerase delta subunit B
VPSSKNLGFLLFSDENLDETRANRYPVITAKPNKNVTAKKARNNKVKLKTESKANVGNVTEVEEQVQSFQTLLNHLATICKNNCQMANEKI